MILIKNGLIHNAIDKEPFRADILIKKGKIVQIRENIEMEGAEIYDVQNMNIYPGFIDAHSHIGMFGVSGAATKDDAEYHDRITPNHRGIDIINPDEPSFKSALRGGVTCVCAGPGSVGCISGTHVAVKTYGDRIDDMIVKNPVAMKVAFGENPKKSNLTSRATISADIRDTLIKAREYYNDKCAAEGDAAKMPRYNEKFEALIPVIEKKIPLKAHAHRKDDIFSAIRLAKECDVNLTIEHASDCGEIADTLAKEAYPIAVGPFFAQAKKEENSKKSPAAAVKLIRAGACVSVMTDAPVVEEEYLPLTAGLLMREGLDEFEALKTITINPAKHLGIEDKLGSIEVGKDADFVIANGCPMQMAVKPLAVFVNGKLAFPE